MSAGGKAADRGLLPGAEDDSAPLLVVDNLTIEFGHGSGAVRAVEDVSLTVRAGEICALVGESGCGKSTLAYALLGIVASPGRATAGDIRFRGRSCLAMSPQEINKVRGAELSMVFQAAMNAFNPVLTIGKQVQHILAAHPECFDSTAEGRAYFEHLLELVQLPPARIWKSYESQLSGGMKQRVAIALALLLKPSVVVLDEPTTALDVLNQRLVIDILKDLHRRLGVTVVFVTHDLAVVAELANRVAVMYAGRLVEVGGVDEIFGDDKRHPYVEALINAIPSVIDTGVAVRPIGGSVPNLAELPAGCRFAPRCPLAEELCHHAEPALLELKPHHLVACHVVTRTIETTADQLALSREARA